MPTCPECNKRAAKRYCPALRTKICAACCAEERMIELACPETCDYLRSARESVRERELELRRREAAASGTIKPEVTREMLPMLLTIESAIVSAQRGTKGSRLDDLNDQEALAAVETAIKNLQTEESGLIYEHRATTTRIEEVSRLIRSMLDELAARLPAEAHPQHGQVLQALERVRESIQAHIKRGEGARSYLRFVALYLPWPKEAAGPQIIT